LYCSCIALANRLRHAKLCLSALSTNKGLHVLYSVKCIIFTPKINQNAFGGCALPLGLGKGDGSSEILHTPCSWVESADIFLMKNNFVVVIYLLLVAFIHSVRTSIKRRISVLSRWGNLRCVTDSGRGLWQHRTTIQTLRGEKYSHHSDHLKYTWRRKTRRIVYIRYDTNI